MPGVVNTELATGLQEARGVKNINPEDVADEIVDALKVPRFDVFVPKLDRPDQQGHGRCCRAAAARRSPAR